MRLTIGLAAAVAALALAACDAQQAAVTTSEAGRTVTSREGEPDVIDYTKDDAAMNGAVADAQAHLPYFWEHSSAPSPNEESFALKVAFPTPSRGEGSREHIWVTGFEKISSGYAGLLANEPLDIVGKKLGDRIEFTSDMITDWGFLRDGKMIGYYTTRISLDEGDPQEAAAIRAMLGENPK
jgi:uncharacterized protein YegJ (DUF2314 family)